MVAAVLARERPASARKVFERFPERERRARASVLMISTDPQEGIDEGTIVDALVETQ
jgi:hypothetical protein